MAWYKDEGERFDLGSFKALGGAYAVFRVLAHNVKRRAGNDDVKSADLVGGRYRDITSAITVTAATDGNHGRSVAWGARTFGCRCVIYLPTSVSEWRQATIARYGAEVVCVPGHSTRLVHTGFGLGTWTGGFPGTRKRISSMA